jgi:TetR/AcrR family transcriptional repressor of bet genes
MSPGLIHHHFNSKEDLLDSLLTMLMGRFRSRLRTALEERGAESELSAYADAALRLDAKADAIAAKCWVGVFAEAIRHPALFQRVRRLVDAEVVHVRELSGRRLDDHKASAIVAFVMGSLVFGAFAPRKAAGFAAPSLKELLMSAGATKPG